MASRGSTKVAGSPGPRPTRLKICRYRRLAKLILEQRADPDHAHPHRSRATELKQARTSRFLAQSPIDDAELLFLNAVL
jgi:hypothetical protein